MAGQPSAITFANAKPEHMPKVHLATFTSARDELTQRYGIGTAKAEELATRITVLRAKARLIELMGSGYAALPMFLTERKKHSEKDARIKDLLLLGYSCILDEERSNAALLGSTPPAETIVPAKPANSETQEEPDLRRSLRPSSPTEGDAERWDIPSLQFLARHGEVALVSLNHDTNTTLLAALKGMNLDEAAMSEYGKSLSLPARVLEVAAVDDAALEMAAKEAIRQLDAINLKGRLQSMWDDAVASYDKLLAEIAKYATKERAHIIDQSSEGRKTLRLLVLGDRTIRAPINLDL